MSVLAHGLAIHELGWLQLIAIYEQKNIVKLSIRGERNIIYTSIHVGSLVTY